MICDITASMRNLKLVEWYMTEPALGGVLALLGTVAISSSKDHASACQSEDLKHMCVPLSYRWE